MFNSLLDVDCGLGRVLNLLVDHFISLRDEEEDDKCCCFSGDGKNVLSTRARCLPQTRDSREGEYLRIACACSGNFVLDSGYSFNANIWKFALNKKEKYTSENN